ncbi:tyrosine-type recombinase/integrase [Nocardioides panzhihuensis]|uniref:Integrase n=1 Tax=Nocardioides panzhihuensis TaxID=860243 RepID=A0A7Z0DKD3_9ACTN|nr:site-specific integrase [Nocardioides panzhihuensis]NYI77012.1 integrase [Nocardioides panzhihuensis]
MVWIEKHKRSDKVVSAYVVWRLGGGRDGEKQFEAFSAGTSEQNLARAEGFQKMVVAAGSHWPDGWVKGEGFVRPNGGDPTAEAPAFSTIGEEYIRQIVDITPGQRKKYLSQVRVLARLEVRGRLPFAQPVSAISEPEVKAWLIDWDRALKTKANYHGLMYGVFNYAVEQGFLTVNPCARTAPKRRRVKQSQAELRFLSEDEFAAVVAKADGYSYSAADLIRATAGTGLRFGEITALWVSDVDLRNRTIRVNKAWKRVGENGETEVPSWLKKQIRDKHTMREHYLGNPKTPKSRRTVSISSSMATILEKLIEGKAANDFVFVSPTGRPVHNSDFYTRVWRPLMDEVIEDGIASFRFHDLRHTHVSWLIAGGAPLPHIQARLGHESITTTIDTYGHLLPAGDELISDIIDAVMNGEQIRPPLHLLRGGVDAAVA